MSSIFTTTFRFPRLRACGQQLSQGNKNAPDPVVWGVFYVRQLELFYATPFPYPDFKHTGGPECRLTADCVILLNLLA
jgi:hypothetical protein